MSPGFVNAEYTAKFATTPEIGLTSANFDQPIDPKFCEQAVNKR